MGSCTKKTSCTPQRRARGVPDVYNRSLRCRYTVCQCWVALGWCSGQIAASVSGAPWVRTHNHCIRPGQVIQLGVHVSTGRFTAWCACISCSRFAVLHNLTGSSLACPTSLPACQPAQEGCLARSQHRSTLAWWNLCWRARLTAVRGRGRRTRSCSTTWQPTIAPEDDNRCRSLKRGTLLCTLQRDDPGSIWRILLPTSAKL